MGTDIHIQIEVRVDGKWIWLQKMLPEYIAHQPLLPDNRNYNLFAILADVRNGKGFAGCDTGDGFIPISKPKGLPDDLDPDLEKAIEEDWAIGEHSFSYLTGEELKDYNWDRKTRHRGWVGLYEFEVFLRKGRPDCYSGGVDGRKVMKISNKLMKDLLLHPEKQIKDISYYTQVEWESSYKDSIGWSCYWAYAYFYDDLISYEYKHDIKPEDVRIVFGFDS